MLGCHLNPIKVEIRSNVLESLMHYLVQLEKRIEFDENLFNSIFKFMHILIQSINVSFSFNLTIYFV